MRQAFWKGIEVETIPLRADGKRTQTGPRGGVSRKELLAPVGSETPPPVRPRARALGTEAGREPQQLSVLAVGLKRMVVQRALLYSCQGRRVCF